MSTSLRRAGRATGILLLSAAVLASGLVIGTVPPAAVADAVVAQPGELVVNGGGELPVTVGWTGQLGRATHNANGYPPSVIVDENGLTGATYDGGAALLTGVGAASVATQTVDLAPSAAAIDNGNVDALISAYIGGYANQADNARVGYSFRDGQGAEVASALFGPVLPADRNNVSGFVPFADSIRLPVGTRSAVITITTQRFIAPANDGYIDNVSLILDAPSPAAAPDVATTDQGVPVTIEPAVNDLPGAGATIVPSSVRLLDGTGAEVTTLTTAEGTYTVDTLSGDVEFVPAADFFGTTAPVPYRVTDSSGQRADSTITVEVAFVATPGLSVVKSASPSDESAYVLGAEITYSFVVTNTGNVRVDGIAISEDAFTGAGTTPVATCPQSSVEPGAQVVCTATYTLVQADIDDQGVSNTASASGTPEGFATPVESDPSSFDIPVAPNAALSLVKTADAAGAARAGDVISYAFRVTNTGNVTLPAVGIAETDFTGSGEIEDLACPAGALAPGAFTVCSASYGLTQQDVDAGGVSNTAEATASWGGSTQTSAPSTADVLIVGQPAFTFVKSTASAELTQAGQIVDYTFRVTNTGTVTLGGIAIDDSDFSGTGELGEIVCPAASVAPGAHVDCAASYTVQAEDLAQSTLSNSATASVTWAGSTLGSDVSTSVVPVVVPDDELPVGGGAGDGSGSAGADRLPDTGGTPAWPFLAGAGITLVVGAALLVIARRRRGGSASIDR